MTLYNDPSIDLYIYIYKIEKRQDSYYFGICSTVTRIIEERRGRKLIEAISGIYTVYRVLYPKKKNAKKAGGKYRTIGGTEANGLGSPFTELFFAARALHFEADARHRG